jgi:hypothetical protein
MEKTKNACDALDLCGVIMAAYRNTRKEKVQDGPRFSKFPVGTGHKFKIHVPSRINADGLQEIVEEHFQSHGISIGRFNDLSGEIVHKKIRYFVSLNITDVVTRSVIDGTIKPL